MMTPDQEPKLLSVFAGLFVSSLIVANVASSAKVIVLGPFSFPGGAIVFPVSFIFGDIFTEVYGFGRTRKIIWTGFACLVLTSMILWLVQVLPGASFSDQAAYDKVLGVLPRVVVGSIIAYLGGEFANSLVLSKMKCRDKGQHGGRQALRFILSTVVGEAVDTTVFITIAFVGELSPAVLLSIGASHYTFKVLYETVATPVSTRFANWVKKVEGIDVIDHPEKTNYNPFAIFVPIKLPSGSAI